MSSDTQVCRNLNTALAAAEAAGDVDDFGDVVIELQKEGYVLGNLNPTTEGWIYVWESESDQIIIVDTADDSIQFNAKELTNSTPGATWYVITNEEAIANNYKAKNCVVSLVADDAEFVTSSSSNVVEAINNANDGDYVIVSGDLTFTDTTISKDLTFISVDGTAVVDQKSLKIASDANVTFQNVTFKNATSLDATASSFYGNGAAGTIILDGCTFQDPQWEGVQITPVDGAEVIVKNCTFIVTEAAQHKHDSTTVDGCHRMLHIQAVDTTGACTAKVTIINNTFIGADKVDNSILDVDYIDYTNNLTAYGNVFKKADGTSITSYSDSAMTGSYGYKIFVCKTYSSASKIYMSDEDAFAKFTATK